MYVIMQIIQSCFFCFFCFLCFSAISNDNPKTPTNLTPTTPPPNTPANPPTNMATAKRTMNTDDEIAQISSPRKKQRQSKTMVAMIEKDLLMEGSSGEGDKETQPPKQIIVISPKAKNLMQPLQQRPISPQQPISRDQSMTPNEDGANENKDDSQLNVDNQSQAASESVGVQVERQLTQQQQFKRLSPQLLLDIQMLKNEEQMREKYKKIAEARIKDDRFAELLKKKPGHDKVFVNLCGNIFNCRHGTVENDYKLGRFLVELKDTFYFNTGEPKNYFYTECELLFPFKTTEAEKKANKGVVRHCYQLGLAATLEDALKLYV